MAAENPNKHNHRLGPYRNVVRESSIENCAPPVDLVFLLSFFPSFVRRATHAIVPRVSSAYLLILPPPAGISLSSSRSTSLQDGHIMMGPGYLDSKYLTPREPENGGIMNKHGVGSMVGGHFVYSISLAMVAASVVSFCLARRLNSVRRFRDMPLARWCQFTFQ